MDYYNKYIKYYTKLQKAGSINYFIKNIKELDTNFLTKIDTLQSQCFNINQTNTSHMIKTWPEKIDVMYIEENNKLIYSMYIQYEIVAENTIFLSSVCTAKLNRGQGLFTKAMKYSIDYYKNLGFTGIQLDVDQTTSNNLDSTKRTEIFKKVGFISDNTSDRLYMKL